ncbi:MAG: CdaR family protein [Vicinamibacterales bacterium]
MAIRGFRHLGLKFLSIALAGLLWLVVAGEQIVERALRIPIEFTNLPSQLELTGDTPTVADVRVRGSSGALTRLGPGELVAVLDLRAARPGQRLFHLTAADVRTPFGVEVVHVNPSNVAIAFELSASKVVPVVPAVEGDPAEGYVVGTVRADPATVEVIGPVSALGKLTEAVTEPLSVAGLSTSVRESVTIGVPDPSVRLRYPQSAVVTVNVAAAPVERRFTGVTVTAKGGRPNSRVTPARVSLVVRGAREVLDRLDATAFEAVVDLEGLGRGRFLLPVRVSPPQHLTVEQVEPAQVRVLIP